MPIRFMELLQRNPADVETHVKQIRAQALDPVAIDTKPQGDRVHVKLDHTGVERGFIDFVATEATS